MSDPYLLLSKFEPAATPANPLHSLIDLKGQCGLLRAWEQPSIFYHFLKIDDRNRPTFCVLNRGLYRLETPHLWVFFLKCSFAHCICLFPLIRRSRTAWSECSHYRLASPHFILHCSKAAFSENTRKEERSHICWKGMVMPELVTKG